MGAGDGAPALATVVRMIEDMARLQEAHNREVAEDWRLRGFEYYRAVWVECAELLDHFGWKWWKQQTPDAEQVKLELVDIWHFGLSILLREDVDLAEVAERFHARLGEPRPETAFRTDVEALAAHSLQTHGFSVDAFLDCLNAAGMDVLALYRAYMGKNVLNSFRQRNGYRDGRYRKTWAGREDNEHLVELVAELDPAADDFAEALYAALETRYAQG
jgi:dimeric dUTPase (all-alpha-NTP-PPase superfamily)